MLPVRYKPKIFMHSVLAALFCPPHSQNGDAALSGVKTALVFPLLSVVECLTNDYIYP